MDVQLRIDALTRLSESDTEAAEQALKIEFDKAANSLTEGNQYGRLDLSLTILKTIGHRFSQATLAILTDFIHGIEGRELSYLDENRLPRRDLEKYRNSATLIVRAMKCLDRLRYLETVSVLRLMVELHRHESEEIRRQARQGLKKLSEYNIDVFFGDSEQSGILTKPQSSIVEELEDTLLNELERQEGAAQRDFSAVTLLLHNLLSPEMEGVSSSYRAITIRRAETPAIELVADIRRRSIRLLKRLYASATSIGQKLEVISVLQRATQSAVGATPSASARDMLVRDTLEVLAFFESLVGSEDYQIVQAIEDASFWIFYHAVSDDIRPVAMSVERAIADRTEYFVYKTLVGFRGIFADWQEHKDERADPLGKDEARRERAREYAQCMSRAEYAGWRNRVLDYAKTESQDLATFPIFYFFLEELATAQPELALMLLREDSEQIERFMIPLLRGLWNGDYRDRVRTLIESWMSEGKYLYPCVRQFLDNDQFDVQLLMDLLDKAQQLDDLHTIEEFVPLLVSNFNGEDRSLTDELFVPVMEALTNQGSAKWLFDTWYRPEMASFLESLDENQVELLLRNLLELDRVDFHAEEALYTIAQSAPEKVLEFLCHRTEMERPSTDSSFSFEAIPFRLHKLQEPLSRDPKLAVRVFREAYDGSYSKFIMRGGHVLKTIFPEFAPEFEKELVGLVRIGGEENIKFVLAILRNYEGEIFLHNICKEIVRASPSEDDYRTEIAIVLESMGVVSGEFGMAEAYERKASEVMDWREDPDDRIRRFAEWYVQGLKELAERERRRVEEEIALEKHTYGE